MKAAVFVEPGRIVLEDKPVPELGPGDALIKVTTTTICGTDVHILKGEYPVRRGLIVGHEPVGVIAELGPGVTGYEVGQRVIVGAITPCGQCEFCLAGFHSQCGGTAMGGWKFGNTIDGCQAEYFRVPHAMANLAPVPQALTDEEVLMCPDIMSTGFGGSENGGISIGDTVVVFAKDPLVFVRQRERNSVARQRLSPLMESRSDWRCRVDSAPTSRLITGRWIRLRKL